MDELRNILNKLNKEVYDNLGEKDGIEILVCSSVMLNSAEYWYENLEEWKTLNNPAGKKILSKHDDFDFYTLVKTDVAGAFAGAYYTKTLIGAGIYALIASISYAIITLL
ncbi:MAG: hypothetical protein HOD10_07020 [Candidatus Marinimicrobia bacterium]|nr:hypothetical protein [Candidatus Neomarinimicrobiota bacterium]MBT4269938.1 hypothetical protein [Candidatus Neomarinimicrobiota bacterium]MBT4372527.1 hypothetical protein [Candidatus Neomarinimicrobiota bacterium]MBT4808920.1 hypothetical protein [Candidatus Neomarinimicrobiota bacterium]